MTILSNFDAKNNFPSISFSFLCVLLPSFSSNSNRVMIFIRLGDFQDNIFAALICFSGIDPWSLIFVNFSLKVIFYKLFFNFLKIRFLKSYLFLSLIEYIILSSIKINNALRVLIRGISPLVSAGYYLAAATHTNYVNSVG